MYMFKLIFAHGGDVDRRTEQLITPSNCTATGANACTGARDECSPAEPLIHGEKGADAHTGTG